MTPLIIAAAVVAATPVGQYTWIGDLDYPDATRRTVLEGVTAFELLVGDRGKVEACRITFSSGSSVVDRRSCQLLREHVRFEPAKDHQGRPTYGTYRQKLTWYQTTDLVRQPPDADLELVLSKAPAGAAMPAYVDIAYLVDASGRPSTCNSASLASGAQFLVDVACKSFLAQFPTQSVRTAAGAAVPAVKVAKVKFSLGQ